MRRPGVYAAGVVIGLITLAVSVWWDASKVTYRTYSPSWTETRDYLCGDDWVEREVTIRNVLTHTRGDGIRVSQEVTGADCPLEVEQ